MLFGTLFGKFDNKGILSVNTNQEGVSATIRLVAYGAVESDLNTLAGKVISVTGILVRDKDTRDLVMEVSNVITVPKTTNMKSFPFSAVVTPTDSKISGDGKVTLSLSSYSTNPGRDSGFTGLNVKYYNPTSKMMDMLTNIGSEGNKTQLYVTGSLDFYVGEGSDNTKYTIISIWNRQFEILRSGKMTTGGKKATSAVASSAMSDDDDF